MIIFKNEQFQETMIGKNDIFICAFGYEKRSYFLYDKVSSRLSADNIQIFLFDDYAQSDELKQKIERIKANKNVIVEMAKYDGGKNVQEKIIQLVNCRKKQDERLVFHIDYSSMPRSWYSALPIILKKMLGEEDKVYFWYVAGRYPGDYEEYPSAGIDSFTLLGKPSLRTEGRRTHVVGLSYDTVRTQAMISILDPDTFIACNAYDPYHKEISNNVKSVNSQLLSQAWMEITLQIDDFSFMISKFCEIANEFLSLGDVIFVPDGPKPLIFAMSLVPELIDKVGVTCLHVSRNKNLYKVVDVEPTNTIFGFSF